MNRRGNRKKIKSVNDKKSNFSGLIRLAEKTKMV
jgi:hypothetical protein